jgi:hypothetical protein
MPSFNDNHIKEGIVLLSQFFYSPNKLNLFSIDWWNDFLTPIAIYI